jgi:hypothetical protein
MHRSTSLNVFGWFLWKKNTAITSTSSKWNKTVWAHRLWICTHRHRLKENWEPCKDFFLKTCPMMDLHQNT